MARSSQCQLWCIIGTLVLVQYRFLAPVSARAVIEDATPANSTLPVVVAAVSARHLFDRVRGCFETGQLGQCFGDEVIRLMDRAIDGNVTFRVTPFVIVSKNPAWKAEMAPRVTGQGWAGVFGKLRAFLASRLFQLSLVDEQGHWSGLLLQSAQLEGRGKKHKQKNGGMFSMALMALMAMIAQVILGKVAVLAAVALIMAKIALVFSTLNGLKKSTGSGGGHGSEHVVYDHGGGGGGGGGGWQRSIDPRKPYRSYQYYEDEDPMPYRKRKQVYDYQDPMDGA